MTANVLLNEGDELLSRIKSENCAEAELLTKIKKEPDDPEAHNPAMLVKVKIESEEADTIDYPAVPDLPHHFVPPVNAKHEPEELGRDSAQTDTGAAAPGPDGYNDHMRKQERMRPSSASRGDLDGFQSASEDEIGSLPTNQQTTTSSYVRTGEMPFRCEECGEEFALLESLIRHGYKYSEEKPFLCGQCGKRFSGRSRWLCHRKTHSSEKRYKCGDCEKIFTDRSSLTTHKKVHSGLKRYSCDDCGKMFTQRYLAKHRRLHSGEKPYSCEECGKTFSRRASLIYHRRKHSGEKPYECDDCGKAFRCRHGLTAHKAVHSEVKRFSCDDCGKKFSSASSLWRHRILHS